MKNKLFKKIFKILIILALANIITAGKIYAKVNNSSKSPFERGMNSKERSAFKRINDTVDEFAALKNISIEESSHLISNMESATKNQSFEKSFISSYNSKELELYEEAKKFFKKKNLSNDFKTLQIFALSDRNQDQQIKEQFKKAEDLHKQAESHFRNARYFEEMAAIRREEEEYIRLHENEVNFNSSEEISRLIHSKEIGLGEKIKHRRRNIPKSVSNQALNRIIKKLVVAHGKELTASEISILEKVALNGKFEKQDPLIKKDFWLAQQGWILCEKINQEMNDPKINETYYHLTRRDELSSQLQDNYDLIMLGYAVGLSRIRAGSDF